MIFNYFGMGKKYSSNDFQSIKSHIELFFGDISHIYHVLNTNSQVINIFQIPPSTKYPFYLLVSCGMGSRKMRVPENDIPNRIELLIAVPAYWNMHQLDDIKWGWPFNCLRYLTQYPFVYNTWLGQGHIITNDAPLAPTTDQCGIWLEYPFSYPQDALFCNLSYFKKICFLQMIPLYPEEINYKEAHGTKALEELFGKEFSMVVNPLRRNYCC